MTNPNHPSPADVKVQSSVARMRCIGCGAEHHNAAHDFRCDSCGELLEIFYPVWQSGDGLDSTPFAPGELKAAWLERRTSQKNIDLSGVWRFRDLLPRLRNWDDVITLREGNTPLYSLPGCAKAAGVESLFAKHQGMNPTGSFKDTGMTMAATFARQNGFHWVACASTGNTSASMAAYAARGGLRSLVLIPEGKISWGKLSQALDYGALTCQLRTDFDGCVRVLGEVVRRMPVYLLNSVNPYRIEGQKTAALELMEQMDWEPPEHLIVPGGNLGNCSAIGKALLEAQQLGLITKLPKISVVQAEGANPFVRSVREFGGKKLVAMQAETMATAIQIGNPASWKKALRILEATGGTVEQVSEVELASAKAAIGADGVGCEPASAVTLAGLKKMVKAGFVKTNETVVLVLTGHVLKDPEFTLKFHRGELFAGTAAEYNAALKAQQRAPVILDATADAVLKALEQAEKSATN